MKPFREKKKKKKLRKSEPRYILKRNENISI